MHQAQCFLLNTFALVLSCLVPDKDAQGTNMFSQRTKTWTFPNLKAPAGPAEVYLAVEEEEEEPVSFGSPFRAVLL